MLEAQKLNQSMHTIVFQWQCSDKSLMFEESASAGYRVEGN